MAHVLESLLPILWFSGPAWLVLEGVGCLVVGRLVGWGAGAGLPISAAEYLWSHPSGGRLAPKHSRSPRVQRLFRPLLMSHWPKRVMWPRPAPRDGGAGSLWMGGCSHTAKGCAPWVEGWSRDLEGGVEGGSLKASAGEEVGPSLSCLHQTKSEQRAGAPSGWFRASGWRPALAVSSPACPAPAESEALAWGARWWAREATSREPCPRLSWGVSLGTELSELSRTCRVAAWCAAAGAQSTRAAARGEGGSISRRGRLESLVCGEGRLRAEPALALDGPGCPGGKW